MSDFTPVCYAIVNTHDGIIQGIGQTSIEAPNPPTGSTIVSIDQYNTISATMEDHSQCILVNGVVRLVPPVVPAVLDLTAVKATAQITIDSQAEAARAQFITLGSGQALEYENTAIEVARAITLMQSIANQSANPPPASPTSPTVNPPALNPNDFPWICAEMRAQAAAGVSLTFSETVTALSATISAWQVAGVTIKEIRRTAKLQVEAATASDQIHTILANLIWPKP